MKTPYSPGPEWRNNLDFELDYDEFPEFEFIPGPITVDTSVRYVEDPILNPKTKPKEA